jgi:hypothetical protein
MLKLCIWCIKFESNYNSCIGRNNENTCSNNGSVKDKWKTWWNSIYHINWWFFEFDPCQMLMYFFVDFV